MPSSQLDVQKRQHRERGQPLHRQKFGLLEKHKDYVQRARDYHSKQDRIKTLQEKADLRNKDEFAFGMVRNRTKKGVHIASRGNEAMPVDVVKLLKTQDVKYVQVQRAAERKRIQKLKEQLDTALVDDKPDLGEGTSKGKRTIFTNDIAAVRSREPLRLLGKLKGKAKATASNAEAQSHRERLQAELDARIERENTLARAERELEVQRLLMGKGAKRDILGKRKRGDEDGRTAGDEESDDEFRGGGGKHKLPKPEEGIATKARVWRWRAERRK